MATFVVAVVAVALERIMVVGAAILAILLGWNLFTRAIIPNQSGTISLGDWKVELKTVGPGVFFSLFGTIVLVYVLIKPAQYTANLPADGSASSGGSVTAIGVGTAADIVGQSYVRAINTIGEIQAQVSVQPAAAPATLLPTQRTDLAAASGLLNQLRTSILVAKFGRPLVDEWTQYSTTYQNSKQSLPASVVKDLNPIAPWFMETVANEPSHSQ
jgi:hypothetical protein